MKKIIRILSEIIICIMILVLVFTVGIYNYIGDIGNSLTVEPEKTQKADCIIVLGAGVIGDTPTLALANRLDKAFEVYSLGHTDRIIVSGDHGKKNYDEVNVMRDYLVKKGVEKEKIFMDHAGFSTYETMYRARDVFEVETTIIVTQKLHLNRALYIADKLGLKCQGVVAEDSTSASTRFQSIREYPARLKAFIQCQILHSKPTFLGESIPVSGNGLKTEG